MVMVKLNLCAWYDITSYSVLFLLNVAKIFVVFCRACLARSSTKAGGGYWRESLNVTGLHSVSSFEVTVATLFASCGSWRRPLVA